MEDNNIETKEKQEAKEQVPSDYKAVGGLGFMVKAEELLGGFTYTKQRTVQTLLEVVNKAVTMAFESGKAVGFSQGYNARRYDQAQEAEAAYERGKLGE